MSAGVLGKGFEGQKDKGPEGTIQGKHKPMGLNSTMAHSPKPREVGKGRPQTTCGMGGGLERLCTALVNVAWSLRLENF